MKKIIKLLCITICLVCLALNVTACNKQDYTYWQIEAQAAGEVKLAHVAELSFGSSNVEISEVWFNVSKLKPNETDIVLVFAKTSTSTTRVECHVTASQIRSAKNGWIKLALKNLEGNDLAPISCKTVTIEIVDTMRVNEVYFKKSNGESAKPTFTKGGVRPFGTESSKNLYTKDELSKLPETNLAYSENPAFNIIDEQDKFPVQE